MKYITLLFFFVSLQLFCQCDGRYENEIFSSVNDTTVEYSDVHNWSSTDSGLDMDIYFPANDTASNRPLILFAHGGVYVGGNKNNPTMVSLCRAFAKRGYVTASIQYRLTSTASLIGSNAFDIFSQTVLNSVSDMKAAIRYFRKNVAENNNTYKINPNLIFVGGYSAGAVTASHLSVIDDNQVPAEFQSFYEIAGGIDGNSGSPGYSSEVSGVVNLAGAVNTLDFIDVGDAPMVSMHATNDNTVNYECANALGYATLPILCGSGKIHEKLDEVGVLNDLYTFSSGGHTAPLLDLNGLTIPFISDFLYDIVCGTNAVQEQKSDSFALFPNPCQNTLSFSFSDSKKEITIVDLFAKVVIKEIVQSGEQIDISYLKNGLYFVHSNSFSQILIKN